MRVARFHDLAFAAIAHPAIPGLMTSVMALSALDNALRFGGYGFYRLPSRPLQGADFHFVLSCSSL